MLRRSLLLVFTVLASATFAQAPLTPEQFAAEYRKLPWQMGPGSADVAGKGTLKLGKEDAFLGTEGAKRLLSLMGNPPADGHYALVPTTNDDWVGVFSFDPSGFVTDDDVIDADALLATLKESNQRNAEERKRLGLPGLHLQGWYAPPRYDKARKRLEWGTKLTKDNGEVIVNYTTRILGRTGVMHTVLVSDPTHLDADRRAFAQRLEGFEFVPGEKYSEFREGDKVAGYGLAALIAGGAAAVATKKGLWAVVGGFLAAFWKIIVGVGVAALAGLGKIFGRKKNQ